MGEPGSSDQSEIRDDLNAFGLSIDDNDLQEFAGLCNKYCLSASSLVEKYVAFRNNRGLSDSLSLCDISLFEKENLVPNSGSRLSRSSEIRSLKSVSALPDDMRKEAITSHSICAQADLMCAYLGESEVKRPSKTDSIALVTSVRSQGVHKQSGKILCSFSNQSDELPNPLLQVTRLPSVPVGHKFAWIIHPIENREPVASSRYMYQRPLVKAEILESWTWSLIKRTLESLHASVIESTETSESYMPRGSLSNVLDASSKQENLVNKKPVTSLLRPIYSRMQSRSLVAGRVIVWPEATSAENATHQQRLHPSNACLAGTKRAGGDSGRITLDLTTNASSLVYSLYPGHPVVLTATNLTGRSLTAFEFYQPNVLPLFETTNGTSYSNVPDLHVAVACGPFTTTTSHDISPLLALLKDIKEYRPHVLILLGPLVDSSHPLIEEYRDSTYEELYQSRLNTVAEWCHLLKTSVVIVSSWREICGNPVYPTPPPFGSGKPYWTQKNPELATWYENVTFVWDPCTLRIGPFVMGLSSPDVLFQMSSEEINANCTGDRLARLCRHVLTAANFYPIHPPAESLPLDYPLWQDHAHFPSNRSPHCLVLPSRLRAFIKSVENVVCVNPGLITRPGSTAAGSYARLIFSIKDSSADLQESAMDVVSWAGDEKTATDSTKSGVTILGEVVQL